MFRKTRRDGFHESYYDHPCLIVTERDVLKTDIKGVSWTTCCKRRWYNLFLLSYSDTRAGDYYHSTHSMRMDRIRHFRRHRDCIHPLSKFRNYWDCIILHVVIMHKLLVFAITSIIFYNVHKALYFFAMFLEVIMISDIYINTQSGYIDNTSRKVVINKSLALRNYCSTKLFFHSLCSIPLVFIMYLRYGEDLSCDVCKANAFNCVISFLSISSMFRILELSSYWNRERKTFKSTMFFYFLRIGVILCLIMVQTLQVNDTISLIELMKDTSRNTSRPNFFDEMFDKIYFSNINTTDFYIINRHVWRVVVFLGRSKLGMTHDYSVMYPHYLWKFFAYGVLGTCIIWLLIECFAFVTFQSYFEDDILNTKNYLLNLITIRQLPDQLCLDVKQYFDITATKIKLVEQRNCLYHALPKGLKEEITYFDYCRLIKRIPYFTDWPKEVIEKLASLVKEEIYLDNQVVVEAGVPGDGLVIVDTGLLAVYSLQHEEMGHLIDGDYFGEISLITDKELMASYVVAVGSCKILLLEKIRFRQTMRAYPDIFYWLQEEVKSNYKQDV